ncbi:MAG: hypothetical protein SGCHY_003206 [Lobulomycetales sp.]
MFGLRRYASSSISRASLEIQKSHHLKAKPENKDLVFGHQFTDHMLSVEWNKGRGWSAPLIKPYGDISLDPSCPALHYAMQCFEGMKAYRDGEGRIRMFRPDMNMARLQRSMTRLTLPEFSQGEFLKCIQELLRLDQDWYIICSSNPGKGSLQNQVIDKLLDKQSGYSLYIRPTAIATQRTLGVGPSDSALLFCIASPVGPYYKTGFSAVSLYASRSFVRAWPGGTGDSKLGANYAPGILPQLQVAKDGYQQILWMFGEQDYATEVGTMNFFCYWINESGERELLTPPLDGTILPGVTRDSILCLAKDFGIKTAEQKITLPQISNAAKEGRLLELFGCGTAAIVSPIKKIRYDDIDIVVPLDPEDPTMQAGPLARKFAKCIMDIQYGVDDHGHSEWSVVVDG